MTFEEWIDELQTRFIFDIRREESLMEKLRKLWEKENA
jgi:hypothetical protein